MREWKVKEQFRYRFDNFMAKGTPALIAGLAILSLFIILLAALVLALTQIAPEGGEPMGFVEAAWASLMRTMDAGAVGGDVGWRFRFIMILVTLGGVFIFSALIGVLNSGLEKKIEELRKGRSRVLEKEHTVILGWSPLIFTIISELIVANGNRGKSCIVVMGEKDKVEMEDAIREAIPETGNTRLVCRSGSPIDLNDLRIVSLNSARSIIVMSPDSSNPDADVIKTILAITNNPERRKSPYHLVAEIRDPKNMQVAKMVGKNEVELVQVSDLISRIIAQTCRQSGLSVVYTELLDFGGDEIYFKNEPALVGKTFGESLSCFEKSSVIGLCKNGRQTMLNPAMNTLIEKGDSIIAISADDDTIQLSASRAPAIQEKAIRSKSEMTPIPERTLLIGWNWRAPTIVRELDNYVAAGSMLTILAQIESGEEEIAHLTPSVKNLKIIYKIGDTTDRRTLDELDVSQFDHIIVLSCSDHMEKQQADALTLMTLLHLRDISEQTKKDPAIVSEMLDLRNRELAEVTQADDFIVSDRLISLMMAQVSENKQLNTVFADIFDPEGSEIYLKPASHYVSYGLPVHFYTVVEAARRRGETVIGYRLARYSGDAVHAYGVVVNPAKSQEIVFSENDQIVVLAEG
jgi:ion channel POLLUX/CASTOR